RPVGHGQRRHCHARGVVCHLGAALNKQFAAAAGATCGWRLQPDGCRLWCEGRARAQGLCRGEGRAFPALLYSSLDGKLKAIIEADLLGQIRTGAASGVATKLLAKADANTPAVIGTGKQSRTQIAAVCAVRPITQVKVFSRTAEHREAYARSVEKELGVEVLPASSGQACVAEADVVVTITKSAEPVCRAQWLA